MMTVTIRIVSIVIIINYCVYIMYNDSNIIIMITCVIITIIICVIYGQPPC